MDADQFQRVAKALADPRRFEILEHIAQQGEVGCQRLCGCFPVRQATISHHLKELASAGLVESRRDGQFVYYRTRPAVLEACRICALTVPSGAVVASPSYSCVKSAQLRI